MLQPKDTDIWTVLLVFVVLPVVTYILLGKWSEAAKKKERISLIAKQTAEEALLVEEMAVGSVIPMSSVQNDALHQCANCLIPASTRCSQCKSVWYCSGRCQITHWRQAHKFECQKFGSNDNNETTNSYPFECNVKQQSLHTLEMKTTESGKQYNHLSSRHKIPVSFMDGDVDRERLLNENSVAERQKSNASDDVRHDEISPGTEINGANAHDLQTNLIDKECASRLDVTCDETIGLNSSPETTETKRSFKTRSSSLPRGVKMQKLPKAGVKTSKDNEDMPCISTTKNDAPLQDSSKVASLKIKKMMGLVKSVKLDNQPRSDDISRKQKKVEMLFPYEEFIECFQFEVLSISPRGLLNCGNSCYANAVMQCLTWTRPLIVYLLRRLHSRAGCAKDWCLMCELERHVTMLRESGHSLSPRNILVHVQKRNSQIAQGSQEDAHEFLRLIVASMQSICLESLGGENFIDPVLQDTTFVQHTFGGRLRSKVKCLVCRHESERHENILDLSLEIFGSIKSLEDALAQFTSSEDLDGDNMYRCGRCASYVRARKQLRVQEAPNILTIVLKRFQEGNYGKINKSITFPEILDMIPFMTGTDDIPPLYMLYAVVVHVDTSNASFSGHYISYVKDLRGNWFMVDDTEVQPVELRQVMSEGAYILFYMRSQPRPARGYSRKTAHNRAPVVSKHLSSKVEKSSKTEQTKPSHTIKREPPSDHKLHKNVVFTDPARRDTVRETRSKTPSSRHSSKFSHASSSDRSLFTSSDDSSFTTESTIDSFSPGKDSKPDAIPFSPVFRSLHPAEAMSRRTISCNMFPRSKSQTRYAPQDYGFASVSSVQSPTSGDWVGGSEAWSGFHPTMGLHGGYNDHVLDNDSIDWSFQTR